MGCYTVNLKSQHFSLPENPVQRKYQSAIEISELRASRTEQKESDVC